MCEQKRRGTHTKTQTRARAPCAAGCIEEVRCHHSAHTPRLTDRARLHVQACRRVCVTLLRQAACKTAQGITEGQKAKHPNYGEQSETVVCLLGVPGAQPSAILR